MRITYMRDKATGKVLSDTEVNNIVERISNNLTHLGFNTGVYAESATTVKIGLHMKCFTIDTVKLGYNARMDHRSRSIKGFARTNIPTWEQREDFNHAVNDVLDAFGVSANIKSGEYKVRCRTDGRVDYWSEISYGMYGNPQIVHLDDDREAEG